MNKNPDSTKQPQTLIFSRKVQIINHPLLFPNQNIVLQTTFQKKFRNIVRWQVKFH